MVDTIYALSSGRPPAGVAVLRISGPQAGAALAALTAPPVPVRHPVLRTLRDPANGSVLDRALVLRFDAPASATGEDVVELHLHGGPAVVAAMLRVLAELPGLRLAAPGEFTRRGFDNGRLDLTQAEGLADLIGAETEAQRHAALDAAGGRLRSAVERWRSAIISLCAGVEAEIDFAEDSDDVAVASAAAVTVKIKSLHDDIAAALRDSTRGRRMRDGLTIAVVGPPNSGKSSLVNMLARRDVAIVTEHAGTTRDTIELPLDLGGVAVTIIDTAGLRETSDPVEAEGIRRARARADTADLVLHIDTKIPAAPLGQIVINKIDLSAGVPDGQAGVLYISAATGAGIADLENWLTDWARGTVRSGEPALVTQARHQSALQTAADELAGAIDVGDIVLRAESLRMAARALGCITGLVGVEDVLDEIFSRFCIGK